MADRVRVSGRVGVRLNVRKLKWFDQDEAVRLALIRVRAMANYPRHDYHDECPLGMGASCSVLCSTSPGRKAPAVGMWEWGDWMWKMRPQTILGSRFRCRV